MSRIKTIEEPSVDPAVEQLKQLDDQELQRIAMNTKGRIGEQAFITLSERNIARKAAKQPFTLQP